MLRKKLKLANVEAIAETPNQSEPNETKKSKATKSKALASATSILHTTPFWKGLYAIECRMNDQFNQINFVKGPVAAVYNPIVYAAELHCAYLEKYLTGPKSVLFIGMNPGPWGMVQTGVPFGYVPAVRDWLKLAGKVNKPDKELPSRPVTGLNCDKVEQSGQRFWSLLEAICGDNPNGFFEQCFIYNYCPLAFFHASGRNITPAEIKPVESKKAITTICLPILSEVIQYIAPQIIISVGRYTEHCVNELQKDSRINGAIQHLCMPHPSPRSLNNTNWNAKAEKWLADNDIMKYIKRI